MPLRRLATRRPARAVLAGLLTPLLLAGCLSTPAARLKVYQDERFTAEDFSRLFDAPAEITCEAARRALLSQGYVVTVKRADAINGVKSFQPEGDVHVQIEFHVVCAAEGAGNKVATAYVNALQDRYALKKSNNSASLGVAAIGSVSIPLSSSEDSLVKVASETIPAGPFYDRFFALMQRYVREQTGAAE